MPKGCLFFFKVSLEYHNRMNLILLSNFCCLKSSTRESLQHLELFFFYAYPRNFPLWLLLQTTKHHNSMGRSPSILPQNNCLPTISRLTQKRLSFVRSTEINREGLAGGQPVRISVITGLPDYSTSEWINILAHL